MASWLGALTDDAAHEDEGVEDGEEAVIEGLLLGLLRVSNAVVEHQGHQQVRNDERNAEGERHAGGESEPQDQPTHASQKVQGIPSVLCEAGYINLRQVIFG